MMIWTKKTAPENKSKTKPIHVTPINHTIYFPKYHNCAMYFHFKIKKLSNIYDIKYSYIISHTTCVQDR